MNSFVKIFRNSLNNRLSLMHSKLAEISTKCHNQLQGLLQTIVYGNKVAFHFNALIFLCVVCSADIFNISISHISWHVCDWHSCRVTFSHVHQLFLDHFGALPLKRG